MNPSKATYKDLEKRIRELEKENLKCKQLSDHLQESEAHLRSILNNTTAVVYVKDVDGRYLLVNKRYEELFHITNEEIVGKNDYDLFPKENAEKFIENDKEILKNNAPVEFEELVPHSDGIHTYLSIKFPLHKIDGTISSVCGISTDITERKRMQAMLQDAHDVLERSVKERTDDLLTANEKLKNEISERNQAEIFLNNFRSAVEYSSDAIGMATPAGNHWYQNKAFDELFGEIGNDPPASIYTDEKVGREIFKTIMGGGQWKGEVRMNTGKGGQITVLLRAYAIKDEEGEVTGLVGVHTDITGLIKTEKALQESEQKYRDLIDRTPDLMYRTDMAGKIIFISPSVYRLSGYTVQEAMGMKMAEEVYAHPEERQLFLKELSEKGYVNNFETILLRKDGSEWLASTNAHFYKDHEGNVQGVEGITRDITDIKEAEEERKQLEMQLNREDKMKSLGLMAGGIAHDLNNILSGIVSYPELILMKLPADSPIRNSLELIKDSGQRAADVVSDLLTIARGVTAGKEILNLNDLIEDYNNSAEYLGLRKKHNNITFMNVLDSDLLNIYGSVTHLKKILMNLVTNASESISKEGIVTIKTKNRYLDKPLRSYEAIEIGEYVMLSVADSGSGINHEDLERIFEPFYTKKIMGKSGTGLGLSVVWNAVQDHDGYIDVESSQTGTTFELYFPVTREPLINQPVPAKLEDYQGNGEKLLVIDDEKRQQDIAYKLLTQMGYEVNSVSSGEEALDFLKESKVDLIILDMIMEPGIDGLDTYKEVLKIYPNQKAIITSGYSETDRVVEAQRLGAGSYVKKPYVLEVIGIAVKKELEK